MPELPIVRTPDSRRNSRPSTYLKTTVTELKYVRCRNSRRMSELPTVETPDSRQNSRPSRLLKTSRWPLVIHTGHVRYDQDSEPSKSVKVRDVGTPDHCWNFRPSELPTNQPENNIFTVTGQIPDTSGMHTGWPDQQQSVSSFVSQTFKSHMGWLEHL